MKVHIPDEVVVVEVIDNKEILKGKRRAAARPNNRISMSVRILLNGVCGVNGGLLLQQSKSDQN